MIPTEIIKRYENSAQISDQNPGKEFVHFFQTNQEKIKNIILRIKNSDSKLEKIGIKIGMMYPPNAMIDESIKELCSIPFRREDGAVFACEGVIENWKGCPPHSPKVSETIADINKSSGFLIMQFNGLNDTIYQKFIHQFTLEVRKALLKTGYDVIQSYSCGPCRMCAQGCNSDGDCRIPTLRLYALESCGFWVNHLCRKAMEYSIHGGDSWEIDWVTDWNLPTQYPESYRSVTGILIG
jgi:predicted metal-binding protein